MVGGRRCDIIAAFITVAALSKQGAATYYYNLTAKAKKEAAAS
jgi:hypothetical protein